MQVVCTSVPCHLVCVCGVCVYHLPCTYHLHHLCTQAIYNHLVLDTTVIDLALNRIGVLET